jgi:hypothetical protein
MQKKSAELVILILPDLEITFRIEDSYNLAKAEDQKITCEDPIYYPS